jgi:hypothetical protein
MSKCEFHTNCCHLSQSNTTLLTRCILLFEPEQLRVLLSVYFLSSHTLFCEQNCFNLLPDGCCLILLPLPEHTCVLWLVLRWTEPKSERAGWMSPLGRPRPGSVVHQPQLRYSEFRRLVFFGWLLLIYYEKTILLIVCNLSWEKYFSPTDSCTLTSRTMMATAAC